MVKISLPIILSLVTVVASIAAGPVATAQIGGCATITTDTSLSGDIVATTSPCIVFGADNISLFMNGHTIDVQSLGNAGVAIHTNGKKNLAIVGNTLAKPGGSGVVLSTFQAPAPASSAIMLSGGGQVELRRVSVLNVVPIIGGLVPLEQTGGTGLRLTGINGANVSDCAIHGYARGIWILDSSPTLDASALIRNNLVDSAAAEQEVSFGIRLENSSGWTVNGNHVAGSGRGGSSTTLEPGIGLVLSHDNVIVRNRSSGNRGAGITAYQSGGNVFVLNVALENNFFFPVDLMDVYETARNIWNANNICRVESGAVPPSVCNPEEGG